MSKNEIIVPATVISKVEKIASNKDLTSEQKTERITKVFRGVLEKEMSEGKMDQAKFDEEVATLPKLIEGILENAKPPKADKSAKEPKSSKGNVPAKMDPQVLAKAMEIAKAKIAKKASKKTLSDKIGDVFDDIGEKITGGAETKWYEPTTGKVIILAGVAVAAGYAYSQLNQVPDYRGEFGAVPL